MRKAFKVATVFTGAAACAAAFAPAAGAATTARNQQMEPATSHRNCVVGPKTSSTVLRWPTAAHHGPTCVSFFGNPGTPTLLGNNFFTFFCAGNNGGSIIYGPPAKPTRVYGPGSGTGTLSHDVRSVSIFFWSNAGHLCNTTF